jgi:hypothetical protein
MILEYAQLLCTAHRVRDGSQIAGLSKTGRNRKTWIHPDAILEEELYSVTHVNHPSAVWARESPLHYMYLYNLFLWCNYEFRKRYNKSEDHVTVKKFRSVLSIPPMALQQMKDATFTEPPQCMPDECKVIGDSVQAYKNYYNLSKIEFARWKNDIIPDWFAPDITDQIHRFESHGQKIEPASSKKIVKEEDPADKWLRENDPTYKN